MGSGWPAAVVQSCAAAYGGSAHVFAPAPPYIARCKLGLMMGDAGYKQRSGVAVGAGAGGQKGAASIKGKTFPRRDSNPGLTGYLSLRAVYPNHLDYGGDQSPVLCQVP